MASVKNCFHCVRRHENNYCPSGMIKRHGFAYAQWCPWFKSAETVGCWHGVTIGDHFPEVRKMVNNNKTGVKK